MKAFLFLFLFSIFFFGASSQNRKAIIGLEYSISVIKFDKHAFGTPNNLYSRFYSFTPKVGIFLNDRTLLAIQGGRSFSKSNFLVQPTVYNLGFLGRYYFRKTIESSMKIKKREVKYGLLPYFEYNHLWTNLHPGQGGNFTNTGKNLNFQVINPILGVNLKVGKSFAFDIGYRALLYYTTAEKKFDFKGIAPKVGLEYFINSRKK
jgi:hypothetical protein